MGKDGGCYLKIYLVELITSSPLFLRGENSCINNYLVSVVLNGILIYLFIYLFIFIIVLVVLSDSC